MTDIPTDVSNQIYRPTIKQLLKWNGEALRKLECVRSRALFDKEDRPVKEDWELADSQGNVVDAKLIRGPRCVQVTYQCHGSIHETKLRSRKLPPSPLLERPFHISISPPSSSLTYREFKMVLGDDYETQSGRWNENRLINAMWRAIEECPTLAANAYVLGQQHHEQPRDEEVIIQVQYYHINPRRHRALIISQYNLDSLLEEIKEERKEEDARYNIKSAP